MSESCEALEKLAETLEQKFSEYHDAKPGLIDGQTVRPERCILATTISIFAKGVLGISKQRHQDCFNYNSADIAILKT